MCWLNAIITYGIVYHVMPTSQMRKLRHRKTKCHTQRERALQMPSSEWNQRGLASELLILTGDGSTGHKGGILFWLVCQLKTGSRYSYLLAGEQKDLSVQEAWSCEFYNENSGHWFKGGSEGFEVLKDLVLKVRRVLCIYHSVVENCFLC